MNCISNTHKKTTIKLPVHGQGVFLFENKNEKNLSSFIFYNKKKTDGIKVELLNNNITVWRLSKDNEILHKLEHSLNIKGKYYWFSLDSQNQKFYAGIGEARMENIIYQHSYPTKESNPEEYEKNKLFLESLHYIEISGLDLNLIKLLKDPIPQTISMIVKNINELTMTDIAKNNYMPKSCLNSMGQMLYDCIAGEKFVLDDDDFPDFSKAIEYSINTPKKWCYEKLKAKSTEFNKDKPNILETYLRITLGQNNGESPGIPYVMEIWPVGHYSPIHNHAGANAIIRVLHGQIHVSLYPYLSTQNEEVGPFKEADFNKNDITWISPNFNQTHKLTNLGTNKDTCVTIQCYMYDNEGDKKHYDYFDYLDADGAVQQYEPDSDMDFIEFKELMRKEWSERGLFETFIAPVYAEFNPDYILR